MTNSSKADFWREHINAWQSSGLSQAVYCRERDLKLNTFAYWRNKQNKPRRKLMPVSMAVPEAPVELALPCGVHLQLPVAALDQVLPPVWRLLRDRA